MSNNVSESAAAESLGSFGNSLMELRLESTCLEAYVSEALSQIKSLRSRLSDAENGLALEYHRFCEQGNELETLREALRREGNRRREIAEILKRAEEAEAALEIERKRVNRQGRLNKELQSRLDNVQRNMASAERERDRLRQELEAARRTANRSTRISARRKEPQDAPEAGRNQHDVSSQQMRQPPGQAPQLAGAKLRTGTGLLAELEEERRALEVELEQARRQAATLANILATERNRFAHAKDVWTKERKKWKCTSTDSIGGTTASALATENVCDRKATVDDELRSPDVVVDTVLAQFARFRGDSEPQMTTRGYAPRN
jgi:hypothetical protein